MVDTLHENSGDLKFETHAVNLRMAKVLDGLKKVVHESWTMKITNLFSLFNWRFILSFFSFGLFAPMLLKARTFQLAYLYHMVYMI